MSAIIVFLEGVVVVAAFRDLHRYGYRFPEAPEGSATRSVAMMAKRTRVPKSDGKHKRPTAEELDDRIAIGLSPRR